MFNYEPKTNKHTFVYTNVNKWVSPKPKISRERRTDDETTKNIFK